MQRELALVPMPLNQRNEERLGPPLSIKDLAKIDVNCYKIVVP
jgi:hypothetical protein